MNFWSTLWLAFAFWGTGRADSPEYHQVCHLGCIDHKALETNYNSVRFLVSWIHICDGRECQDQSFSHKVTKCFNQIALTQDVKLFNLYARNGIIIWRKFAVNPSVLIRAIPFEKLVGGGGMQKWPVRPPHGDIGTIFQPPVKFFKMRIRHPPTFLNGTIKEQIGREVRAFIFTGRLH